MRKDWKKGMGRMAAACLAVLVMTSCSAVNNDPGKNLIRQEDEAGRVVNLFSPMEKTGPDAENVARSAADLTVAMAEEKLGVSVAYRTYTAEDYQDRTYDEVALDRVRSNMDDMYLLNPDIVLALGAEGALMDLSGLECADNLREVVRTANTGGLFGVRPGIPGKWD